MNANQDADHLGLLSIFHFVVAGILALCSMFPVLHLVFGIAILSGAFEDARSVNAPPAWLGWVVATVASVAILSGLVMASCVALAGRRLGQRRNYMYCLVVAGIECIFMPFGTVLGAFTIVVLMRPSVKQLFEFGTAGPL